MPAISSTWLFRGAKAGAKALGRAALQTGSHILSDIADNPAGYKDIISKHIQETLPTKMAGGGRRKRRRPPSRTTPRPAKRRRRAPSTRKLRGKNLSEGVVAVELNVGLLGPL